MAEITFRDFAGAVMGNDLAGAGRTLEELLGLNAEAAAAAAQLFHERMKQDPAFMMKAMGLRTALAGSDEDLSALLGECFGLQGAGAATAVAALRTRYPSS